MNKIDVQGTVADGFEAVREAFAAVVAEDGGGSGAQLAAFVHGRQVVDLWAGDEVSGETLTGVYSSTKGAAILVVALLVQDGTLELDEPVAVHWPEFAAARTGSPCGTSSHTAPVSSALMAGSPLMSSPTTG